MESLPNLDQLKTLLFTYAPSVIKGIVVLIIGLWLIGWITGVVKNIMKKRNMDDTIRPFLLSLINVGLKVMLLLTVAGMFGIQTTSFIAVLGALAFAIGMALQGSLGNFASGIMVLLFKPYRVGDLVEIQGFTGVVSEIQIFNTVLLTLDNKKVILPNSVVTGGAIVNISGPGEIRVDMTFGIGYSDDIDKAREIIQQVADECPQILKSKPVDIFVSELADSSVNFAVRPWANSAHYWDVFFFLQENIKKQFDKNNINIPFPQMEVHLSK